jgi:hypothetical protein
LPTSSAFLRAARTSSVSSPICLPTFLACLPDFFTCFATPLRPLPVPGIGMPRTFFGPPFSFLPRTTPPTTPAAAVTTPVTTAAFDDPFPPFPPLERFEPLERLELLGRLLALPEERDDPEERDAELRLRDDADEDRPLEALVFDFDEPLREDPLRVLGLDPLELLLEFPLEDLRLVPDPELAWAISPP